MENLKSVWPQWEIEEKIGEGSYGKVYKIRRKELGYTSYAALKIIEFPKDQSEVRELVNSGMDYQSIRSYYEDIRKNLLTEIQVMESLKTGRNIVAIEDHSFQQHEENVGWTIYIRMELLESLSACLEKTRELPVKEIVKIGVDICSALECCEQSHIIHRDIKPDNIFRNRYGDYKLGDFGIAKQMEITKSVYSQKGTSMYMAPEVFRGEHYDRTVDIYSLGIMLYKLLNHGRYPFMPPYPEQLHPRDAEEAMRKRINGEKMPLPACAQDELGGVVLRACAFKPEWRYQSASELREKLKETRHSGRTGVDSRTGTGSKAKDTGVPVIGQNTVEAPADIYVQEQSKSFDPEKTYGAWERTVSAWGEKEVSSTHKEAAAANREVSAANKEASAANREVSAANQEALPAHKEQEEKKQEPEQKFEEREPEKSQTVYHWESKEVGNSQMEKPDTESQTVYRWEPENISGNKENQQTWQETKESESHGLDKGAKIRLSVFVAVVFVILLVITVVNPYWSIGNGAAISDHSQDGAEIQDKPEIEEIEAAPSVAELGEDWESCTVQINDTVIALPCNVTDFTNIGLSISTEGIYEDTRIASGEYIGVEFSDGNGNEIGTKIVNSTDREMPLSECLIGEVDVSVYGLESGGLTVQFPGGIQVGSTVEAIVEKYGEADSETLNDDGSVKFYALYSTDYVKSFTGFFEENRARHFFLGAVNIYEYTQHE